MFSSSVGTTKPNLLDNSWGTTFPTDLRIDQREYLFGIHYNDIWYGEDDRVITLHLFGPLNLVGRKEGAVSGLGLGYDLTNHLSIQAGGIRNSFISGKSWGLQVVWRF